MKRIYFILLALLLFPWPAQSWWSFERLSIPLSSHRLITQRAMSLIQSTTEYPDLSKFSSVVLEATTGDSNDANAHGKILANDLEKYPLANQSGRFNGGPFGEWQLRLKESFAAGTLINAQNTVGAYYYVGLMAHLLQDQAVPAHSANIYHGQVIGDHGCIPSSLIDTFLETQFC